MPLPVTNQSRTLWLFAGFLILLGLAVSFYNPVTHQWGWHGKIPELDWTKPTRPGAKPHFPTPITLITDCFTAALLAGIAARFAKTGSLKAHWAGALLAFFMMSNNIRLGLLELQLMAKDEFGEFKHLWFLGLGHWILGIGSLAAMLPVLLHIRQQKNLVRSE
jgi:hypothetical protein